MRGMQCERDEIDRREGAGEKYYIVTQTHR